MDESGFPQKTDGECVSPAQKIAGAFMSAAGGALLIGLLYFLRSENGDFTFFIAPFASSAVLVFAVPAAPFSQPRNIIAGHTLAALIGVAVYSLFATTTWWSVSLAGGLTIFCMIVLNTIHPPAGATALLPVISEIPDFTWALSPVLAGAVLTVLTGVAYNRLVRKRRYPLSWL
jgi:CBS-domain-containing membrane protein